MSLAHTDSNELLARFKVLSEDLDLTLKELGPYLEKVGRIRKEMEVIEAELTTRDA